MNKDYWEDSRVLYTSVPIKSFGEALEILPKKFMFLKTHISNF